MPVSLEVLASALLNSLWQGGILAVAAWVCLRVLPPVRAGTRYAVWYGTLIAIVLVPAASVLTRLPGEIPTVDGAVVRVAPDVPTTFEIVRVARADERSFLPIRIPSRPFQWLLGIWVLGCAALLVRLTHGYLGLRRLKGSSEPPGRRAEEWETRWRHTLRLGRAPELRTSASVRVPLTAGLLHPIVLFPRALLDSLSEEEVYTIWLHETAHVRRRDDWTKLFQRLAEAGLFFHPGLWWIGRRLNLERELACDEWVIARTGRPKSYAACLCRLAELAASQPHPSPALAMAAERKQIFRRVEMLMRRDRSVEEKQSWWPALALVLLLAAAGFGFTMIEPVFAVASPQETVRPPEPPPQVRPPAVAPASEPVAAFGTSAPPAPAAAPAPAPVPAPRSAPAPAAESDLDDRATVDEIREEMRALAQEQIHRLRAEFQPAMEEIRSMAERIRKDDESEIRLKIEELQKLQRQLQQRMEAVRPTEEQTRRLRQAIAGLELESREKLQQLMHEEQEEWVRKFDEAKRLYEEAMREKEVELRRRITEAQKPQPSADPPEPER